MVSQKVKGVISGAATAEVSYLFPLGGEMDATISIVQLLVSTPSPHNPTRVAPLLSSSTLTIMGPVPTFRDLGKVVVEAAP